MVLKRKRSESEISTSSSLFSSPPSAAGQFTQLHNPLFPISKPALFSSRTRKRHRDNRPSEDEVHQRTLSVLFGAQQNANAQSLELLHSHMTPLQPIQSIPPSHSSSQQSSLHSFWAIPSKPRQPLFPTHLSSHNTASLTPSRHVYHAGAVCEDCSASLEAQDNEDSMDVDMMALDVDERNFGCVECGKQVCHSCAVSNLGADRRCLNCAKPNKGSGFGGLAGWVQHL